MGYLQCVVLSSLLTVSFAAFLTTTSDCGSHADIHSITLEHCAAEPCDIIKGETYTTHINFTSTIESSTASNICSGKIGEVWTPFAVSPDDACGNGVECPVLPGVNQVYTATVTCPADVIDMRLVAQWQVEGDDGDIICFNFPLEIVSPAK